MQEKVRRRFASNIYMLTYSGLSAMDSIIRTIVKLYTNIRNFELE